VKLYVSEEGHEPIRQLRAPLVVSALARVEVPAALWRKHRNGELDVDDTQTLIRAFAAHYGGSTDRPPRFLAVAVTNNILDRAAELSGTHGLRAYDAVQLASALTARDADRHCTTFAGFDRDLTSAATAEGLEALPTRASENTSPEDTAPAVD
jgi:uncharacterized protein